MANVHAFRPQRKPPKGPSPWGTPPGARPQSNLLANLISTAILAAFIGYQSRSWMAPLALVVGVFVHEYGHIMAMNAMGLGPARLTIIPFMGGAATPARPPETEFKDVLVSLAGPVFGLVAAAPFMVVALYYGSLEWLVGALLIIGLNLINLAPAPPLDGSKALGPALARIHPNLERGALLLVGGIAVLWALNRHSWLFAAFVGISVFASLKAKTIRPWARKLTHQEWVYSIILYLCALGACLVAGWACFWALGLPADPFIILRFMGLG